MENFKLEFVFDGHPQTAEVTVHKGINHIQYTVSPEDHTLKEKFGTQVIHRFGDELEFAFPGEGKAAGRYNEALGKALHKALDLGPDFRVNTRKEQP